MASNNDWTTPKALSIPEEGHFTLQQGRYGPTYPRTSESIPLHTNRSPSAMRACCLSRRSHAV